MRPMTPGPSALFREDRPVASSVTADDGLIMPLRRNRRPRLPSGAHIIDRGRVGCPVSGNDVDADGCLTCGSFTQLLQDGEQDLTYVVCDARPRRARASLLPMM